MACDVVERYLGNLVCTFRKEQGHRSGQRTAGAGGLAPAPAPGRPRYPHGRPHCQRNSRGPGAPRTLLTAAARIGKQGSGFKYPILVSVRFLNSVHRLHGRPHRQRNPGGPGSQLRLGMENRDLGLEILNLRWFEI